MTTPCHPSQLQQRVKTLSTGPPHAPGGQRQRVKALATGLRPSVEGRPRPHLLPSPILGGLAHTCLTPLRLTAECDRWWWQVAECCRLLTRQLLAAEVAAAAGC
jgi:hypothetical protein